MPLKFVNTRTRPNTEVYFSYVCSEEAKTKLQQIQSKYTSNGSVILNVIYSNDDLTRISTETFANIEIFESYERDMSEPLSTGEPLSLYHKINQHKWIVEYNSTVTVTKTIE